MRNCFSHCSSGPPSDYHHSGIFSDGINARVRTGVRNCSGLNNLASGIWTRPQYERVVGIYNANASIKLCIACLYLDCTSAF